MGPVTEPEGVAEAVRETEDVGMARGWAIDAGVSYISSKLEPPS